jgi:hypothetical protein
MFGGLEVKSKDSSTSSEPAASQQASASSFSFLQTDTNTAAAASGTSNGEAAAAPESTAPSAFSFLSPVAAEPVADGQSGFSFLSTAGNNSNNVNAEGASTAGSSFSFLGGATVSSRPDESDDGPSAAAVTASSSSFSFVTSASSSTTAANNSNSNNNEEDLLSTTNATLPTGAGISWSAPSLNSSIQNKKPIKKKTGKIRVGNHNNATTASSPSLPSLHHPSESIPPPIVPPSPQSPPLKVKAERVHNSAEEFIREKQRSAIAAAAERAVLEKRDENGAGLQSGEPSLPAATTTTQWKLSNNSDAYAASTLSADIAPSYSQDETYKAAMAAAEEARKLENSPNLSKPKFSLSGFFHRKSVSSSSNGGGDKGETAAIGSYSSHGGVVGRTNGGGAAAGSLEVQHRLGGSGHGMATLPSTREEEGMKKDVDSNVVVGEDNDAIGATTAGGTREQQREVDLHQQMERKRQEEEAAAEAERQKVKQQQMQQEQQKEQEKLLLQQRSPRQKLQFILDSFSATAKSSTDSLHKLKHQHEALSLQLVQSQKNQQLSQQSIVHAESLQCKACEDEDFEAADRLAGVIEGYERERREQLEIGKEVKIAMDRVEKERDEAVEGLARCFGMVYEELKRLEVEQVGRRKEDGTDVSLLLLCTCVYICVILCNVSHRSCIVTCKNLQVLDKFAATSKRLSAETDRLNNDLKHIERDEELVADEQKELEGQIAEGTKEFEEKCAVARLVVVGCLLRYYT